jgi:hypothetical protein
LIAEVLSSVEGGTVLILKKALENLYHRGCRSMDRAAAPRGNDKCEHNVVISGEKPAESEAINKEKSCPN